MTPAFSWIVPVTVWGLVALVLAVAVLVAVVRGLLNRRDDRAEEAARADANVAARKESRARGVGGKGL